MKFFIIAVILTVAMCVYIDVLISRRACRRWLLPLHYIASAAEITASVLILKFGMVESADGEFIVVMYSLLVWLSLFMAQVVFLIFHLIGQVPRLFKRKPVKALSAVGAVLALVVIGVFAWGAFINRYSIDVHEVEIPFDDLPEEFDGYRIAQFSDLHTGSYGTDTAFVSRFVDTVNSLNPDLILFTGDIVNRHSDELVPFVSVLDRLKARDGQFSVLGNHDYADYFYPRDSVGAKIRDVQSLRDLYAQTSLRLLEDESVIVRCGNDSIAVIGVGNIGVGRFPVYGSLESAYPLLADSTFKVLMSHDPNHWVTAIADKDSVNVDLTLSGHTHAMQTSIFGWTPASMNYRTPRGLYTDATARHKLYVNIGTGTVGVPMRIGATPELTLITLRTTK